MDIEKFKKMLTEHKCVLIKFAPSCKANNPFVMHYELNGNTVVECYDYNRTVYGICNIHDERAMTDNFKLANEVLSMKPSTPKFY